MKLLSTVSLILTQDRCILSLILSQYCNRCQKTLYLAIFDNNIIYCQLLLILVVCFIDFYKLLIAGSSAIIWVLISHLYVVQIEIWKYHQCEERIRMHYQELALGRASGQWK